MERTLDYASPTIPRFTRRWPLAALAMTVSVMGAAWAVKTSVDAAQTYLGTFGGCATGRSGALFDLNVIIPMSFSLPGFGWWLAKRVGIGELLCRTSLWAAVAAWATAWILIIR